MILFMIFDAVMAQTLSPPQRTDSFVSQQVSTLPDLVIEATKLDANALGNSDSASQGVVNNRQLQDMPLLRPGEVLESVPGMVVTQHSGDGKANQYFLRGYNLDHGTDFATFVDSVPVNMPTNAHGQGYSDLNFLIPELVQRISYSKGPYFAENGDFSSAGSAKFQYRDYLDSNIANLTVGSFGYRRILLAGSTQLAPKIPDSDSGKSMVYWNDSPTLLGAVDILDENGPWVQPEGLHRFNGLLRLSNGTDSQGWSVDGINYEANWNSTDQVPLQLIVSEPRTPACSGHHFAG